MSHLLFEGPWVQGRGEYPTRIILHAEATPQGEPTKYIVHREYRNEKGNLEREDGNYFHAEWDNAWERAMASFADRCRAHYTSQRKLLYLDQPDDDLLAVLATDPNLP